MNTPADFEFTNRWWYLRRNGPSITSPLVCCPGAQASLQARYEGLEDAGAIRTMSIFDNVASSRTGLGIIISAGT